MSAENQYFIFKDGKIQAAGPAVTIQVNAESDLNNAALKELAPGSIAHLAGWTAAWQKNNDGGWDDMIEGT